MAKHSLRTIAGIGALVVASSGATAACSSASETGTTSEAVSTCPWDPTFGVYGSYQSSWWIEFSVKDTTATAMKVDVAGSPPRTIDLLNRVPLGGGYQKFTGGPSDGPVTSGTLIKLTVTRPIDGGTQSATSNWFGYMKGTPAVDCGDGGVAEAGVDASPADAQIDAKLDAPADVAKETSVDACTPVCSGKQCGDDLCGGSCGACGNGTQCSGGTCVGGCVAPWSPLWQETPYAGAWWTEFYVQGGGSLPVSVSLEVVGGTTYPLAYGYGKWTGGLNYVPSGTQVVLHAKDATGATAKTSPFQYLVQTSPVTDACGGTPSTSKTCLPLSRGMITIAMDDSYPSQDQLAAPLLAKYGFKASVYNITRQLDLYGDLPYAQDLASLGHEVASHTVTHPDLTSLSAQQLDDELRLSQQYLVANVGSPVDSFASPAGLYNATVITAIKKYYTSHRTVNPGMSYMGSSVWELSSDGVYGSSTPASVCAQIQDAATYRGWRILLFHDFTTQPTSAYDLLYPIASFETILQCLKSTAGVDVVTTHQGANAIRCASP